MRDGHLDEFFRHENQACPPALSDGGSLRLGKATYLHALKRSQMQGQGLLDGAAIVQMLKPDEMCMQELQRVCTRDLYPLHVYKASVFIKPGPGMGHLHC